MPITRYTEHQAKLELFHWLNGGTCFSSQLFILISKADNENRHALAQAFPAHVKVWEEWQVSSLNDTIIDRKAQPQFERLVKRGWKMRIEERWISPYTNEARSFDEAVRVEDLRDAHTSNSGT